MCVIFEISVTNIEKEKILIISVLTVFYNRNITVVITLFVRKDLHFFFILFFIRIKSHNMLHFISFEMKNFIKKEKTRIFRQKSRNKKIRPYKLHCTLYFQ